MIVKNESRIIERCLNSVKDVVDYISISDTGSTDNTVEIIENYMKKHNIPGKVHRHTWKNFGYNRSLSVEASQEMLTQMKVPLDNTYLFLMDADMMLVVEPSFSKSELKNDNILLLQKSRVHTYYNTRLIKASLIWKCVGVTHEYWAANGPATVAKLNTLMIDDRDDGGCKADKFERDIRLLTQGIIDEPSNARYMFYLGQSYKCIKNYDESIKWYTARIKMGGWHEEVWYSKFMIAECYEAMGRWDDALHWYLDAFQYDPKRAEPIHNIVKHYRINGEHQLAYLFAKQGSAIPFPKDALLFVSHPIYDYGFDEEMSIIAYYTPFKDDGYQAVNRLILNKEAPAHIKNIAYNNLVYYVRNLPGAHYTPIQIDLPLIAEGSTVTYNPSNPSIQKTVKGYQVICRTVNYAQKGAMEFYSLDPNDPTIRTRNFLLDYDKDFKLLAQNEIIEDLPRERAYSEVKGLEDCRLVNVNGENWFISSVHDVTPQKIVQSLCKLSDNKVEKFLPLKSPKDAKFEKNWLPFVKDGELHVIYSSDPLLVYKIDRTNGALTQVANNEHALDFTRFRGSAGPIEFDGGLLMLLHEVAISDQRFYMHRFVFMDNNFVIQKISEPFTFLHKGIEYCCGMTLDHKGGKCIMTLGYEDRKAYIADIDTDDVRVLLKPL